MTPVSRRRFRAAFVAVAEFRPGLGYLAIQNDVRLELFGMAEYFELFGAIRVHPLIVAQLGDALGLGFRCGCLLVFAAAAANMHRSIEDLQPGGLERHASSEQRDELLLLFALGTRQSSSITFSGTPELMKTSSSSVENSLASRTLSYAVL